MRVHTKKRRGETHIRVRLGGLCTLSAEERGRGHRGMINRGEECRKYMGQSTKEEGYFSESCFCRLISVCTPVCDDKDPSFSPTGGREGRPSQRTIYVLLLGR